MTIDDDLRPSRSALKRQARRVEDDARALLELSDSEIARLGWQKELVAELKLARRVSGHGARKRQVKHLAGLLRHDDQALAAARDLLAERHGQHKEQIKDFHALEELRDRLCDSAGQQQALDEIAARYPGCDRARLESLAGSFLADGDRRAYREIFRLLRAGAEQGRP